MQDELAEQVATIFGYPSDSWEHAQRLSSGTYLIFAEKDYKVAIAQDYKVATMRFSGTDGYTNQCKAVVALMREHLLEALCSSDPYVREMAKLIRGENG